VDTPYIPGYVVDRGCDTPVESFVVYSPNIVHSPNIGYPSNKCSRVLVAISQSFVVEKKRGLCRSYS
jgi:hypothetical protein